MYKILVLIATIAYSNAQPILLPNQGQVVQVRGPLLDAPVSVISGGPIVAEEIPQPYQFAYTSTDEFGTTLVRSETSDANGAVKGSYGYTDAQGLTRFVEYIADEAGFRATIRTNEPGIISSNPADVLIQSTSGAAAAAAAAARRR